MLVLKVTTQEDFATVRWFKDGEEVKNVRKRNQRLKTLSTECQHILAIEKCLTSDAGTYRAETNTQVTTATVSVVGEAHTDQYNQLGYLVILSEFPHYFKHKLPQVSTVTEDAKIELEVSVEDENAAVTWFHDDTELLPEKSR